MLKTKQNDYKILYEKYINQMYSYGKSLGIADDVLYDFIHDIFLHLFEYKNEIAQGEQGKFYLLRSLKNRFISQIRKEVDQVTLTDIEEYDFEISITGLDRIEEEEERKETGRQIEQMLACLTSRQREAIYLRYMQGLEYNEIAELCDLTPKGARKLIYRAIDRLREQYGSVSLLYLFLLKDIFPF